MDLHRTPPYERDIFDLRGESAQDGVKLSSVDMLENLIERKWIFLGVFFGCVMLSIAYIVFSSPVYLADALIQVEERKSSPLGSLSDVSRALDVQDSPIAGELDILRSREVMLKAMDTVAAQAEVSVKNSVPLVGGFLSTILPREPNGLVEAPFEQPHWAWGGEHVVFRAYEVPDDQIGKKLELDFIGDGKWTLKDSDGRETLSGRVGTPAQANGYKVDIEEILARPGTEFTVKRVPTQTRLEQIQKVFSAAETKRQSGVMQLSYENVNPVFAARFVNALAAAYLDSNSKRRAADSERSLAFLNSQLPIVKERVQKAEQALNDFRNKEGTIDVQGEAKNLLDESALIEKERLEARLNYEDFRQRWKEGQPQLIAVENKFKALDQKAAELQSRIASLPSMQQQYLRLARDVEVNNQLYVGLMDNAQQLQIAEAGAVGNAALVDKALVPVKPVRPKKAIVLLLGAAFGVVLGFVVTQLIALFSGRIRDPKRLESMVGIQTLGVLPISPHQLQASSANTSRFMLSHEQSDTPLVEAIDSLAHSLQHKLESKEGSKVVLLTSAVPGQGKSMLSANLAYLYAERGLKTLVIDADMRRSGLHRYLPINREDGLSSVLQGKLDAIEAISQPFETLHVLPAGRHVRQVRNLLGFERLKALIESLRDHYDMILIDSPPVLPMADAVVLSKVADATIFVARQGMVSYSEVSESVSRLNKVGTEVDGLVFNGFDPSPLRYAYYSDAYKYPDEATARLE
ncbi:polysaccharide biosynthesis tyrosine autokinase [Paraburkholderia sp. MMS20-SJTN17]|uniref:Polysaccharide biosynthesis tyrosine autokinase n=1 Tax=Paraburkholderia translucens TaxID=2886945 RepID=A0ABS8KET8_9BURK|nr:polysaccharide biosynthesis tyrosine autokinase [Paraburkholderia sp. MMS20-SJTN17]MCC8403294.1 polysaccharide biosynthesis tyrosine autokinase [Paraburkholderia sp. MMS20-SJTN17]